jgi:hypothetical protein
VTNSQGTEQAAGIVLDPTELRSWSWCTVAEVHERMRPLVARRIEASLHAVGTGETVYLESGYPVVMKPTA